MAETNERVTVIGPLGTVENVAADQLDALLADERRGYSLATPQEVERLRREEKHGGLANKLAAFHRAQAAGLTMDLSNVAIAKGTEAIGGPAALRRLQEQEGAYEELHGGSELAGYLGGAVAGAVTPVGRAARGLALGRAAAPSALRRIGGEAALGALSGAGAAGGQAWAEESLGGRELSGEKLSVAMKTGAAFGAGVGGALAGAGAAFRGARGSFGRVARSGEREANRALTKTSPNKAFAELLSDLTSAPKQQAEAYVAKNLSKLQAKMVGLPDGPRRLVSIMYEGGERGARARDAVFNPKELQEEFVEKLYKELEPLYRKSTDVVLKFRGGAKESQVARALSRADDATWMNRTNASRAYARETEESLERILQDKGVDFIPTTFGKKGTIIKELREEVRALRGLLDVPWTPSRGLAGGHTIESVDARVFMAIDKLKHSIGKLNKGLQNTRTPMTSQVNTSRELGKMYSDTRRLLEDETLWGEAAKMQKEINPFFSRWLTTHGTKPEYNNFLKNFTERAPPVRGMGIPHDVVTKNRIRSYLKGLKNPVDNPKHISLEDFLRDNESMVSAEARALSMTDADRALIEELGESTGRVRAIAEDAKAAVTIGNVGAEIARAQSRSGFLSSAVAGGLLGGPIGAAAGGALGVLQNPMRTVRQTAAVRKLIFGVDQRIRRSAQSLSRGRSVSDASSVGAIAQTAGYASYERRSQAARATAEDPEGARAALTQALSPLSPAVPGVADVAIDRALAAQRYLNTQLPTQSVPEILYGKKGYASRSDLERFMRISDALEDPPLLLDRLQKGVVTRDEVNAVREVYPEMFSEMQFAVAGEIEGMARKGKRLPYSERIHIGTVLDMPELDPSLNPQLMSLIQSGYAQQDQGGPPKKKVDLSEAFAYETRTDNIEAQKV